MRATSNSSAAAISQYCDDNREWYPQSTHPEPGRIIEDNESWIHTLRPYIAEVDEIRVCPADPRRGELLDTEPQTINGETVQIGRGTSYRINYYLIHPVQQQLAIIPETIADFRRRVAVPEPVETIVLFESSDDFAQDDEKGDHTDSNEWFAETSFDRELDGTARADLAGPTWCLDHRASRRRSGELPVRGRSRVVARCWDGARVRP